MIRGDTSMYIVVFMAETSRNDSLMTTLIVLEENPFVWQEVVKIVSLTTIVDAPSTK